MSSNDSVSPWRRVGRGFDRLAPVYDWMLRLSSGRLLPRVRRSLLDTLPVHNRALIPGEGTGEFLCDLMRAGRAHRATVIDVSSGMLARARSRATRRLRAEQFARVTFRTAALPDDPALAESRGSYDLLCTNFFLDVFTEEQIDAVMNELSGQLASGGRWYISDFAYPNCERGWLTAFGGRLIISFLYFFFALSCGLAARRLPETESRFRERGFRLLAERKFLGGLLFTRVYQKL